MSPFSSARQGSLRSFSVRALAAFFCIGLLQIDVWAQGAGRYNFAIASGSLEEALVQFSSLTGLNTSFTPDLVAGKTSAGVRGDLAAGDALQKLLAGTGLEAKFSGAKSVTLQRAAYSDRDMKRLDTVRVRAETDPTQSGTLGLLPTQASVGTSKLALEVREQASVIQIIPRESIEDRGALSVHDVVETVAGVRAVSPAYSSRSAGIRSRGFESDDSFYNGFRFSGFGVPTDSGNIESVEILKGPSSIQYGLTQPGGVLNIVTKRPVAEPLKIVEITAGSFNTLRGDVDLGGAVGEEKTLLTRLNLAAETNEEHRDFDESRRFLVAPAISWFATENTSVDLELSYLANKYRFNRGLPPQAFIFDLPTDLSTGEPNQPLSTNKVGNVFYTLTHRLPFENWTVRQRAGYLRTDSDSFEVNSGVDDIDSNGNLPRTYYSSYQKEESWSVQHELIGEFSVGEFTYKMVTGFEIGESGREYGFKKVTETARGIEPLNVFNPVYGGYVFPSDTDMAYDYAPETYGNRFKAVYSDWHFTFSPQWRLMAGVRLDDTEGYYKATNGPDYGAADSKGVSPRIGLVWTPASRVDLFANYSTGFVPNLFADTAGNFYDTPEKSAQIETGARYEFVPQRLRGTASVFAIRKSNVQTADPTDSTGNRSVLTGEQKSNGLELELIGAVTGNWDISLGYAYVDARTTRHTDRSQIDLSLVDAPEDHVTTWNKYRLGGSLSGWWLGYGAAWVDERRSSNFNSDLLLPSYTRHDLAAGLTKAKWSAQINLGNVTDERVYYTHGNNIHLQPGRNIRVSTRYHF